MATKPIAVPGLSLSLEEKNDETIVHCTGKINAENSEMFQREIRNLIPESRGHVAAITCRIVLHFWARGRQHNGRAAISRLPT
jgi:hypothetical protein